MLLYITSSANEYIFDEVCTQNSIPITKQNKIFDLNTLFLNNNNYDNYKILAIDLAIISNTTEEIIDFFIKFRQLYDAKIVIVGIGRKVGDLLLSKLVNESIFDFITNEDDFLQKEEIKACILGNNGYKDCVKFKIQEPTKEIEKTNKLDKIKDFFNKAKIEKQPKIKYKQEKIEPKPMIIEKEKIIEREKIVEKKVLVKPKINKLKIAVCGTCPRMGTTTQAFLIANYFKSYGFKTCYIESNKSNTIKNIKNFYDISIDEQNKKISYNKLDIFYNSSFEDFPKILTTAYEVFVFDYGEFLYTSEESFASADFRIVVSGTKAWEEKYIQNVFKICHIYNDINFIFNFVDKDEENFILKNMEELKVYFSDYAPNIFKSTNEKIYDEIFKDYTTFNEISEIRG